ncbi:MAG: glycosyltransferase family 2 protein, partial [Microcystaceae cyanobacterium]
MLDLGIVVIGRNEGDRLKTCLNSLIGQGKIVYVDSGSTDGSVEFATKLGVEVINLDLSQPFTAAKARNTGYERLIQLYPDLKYIQFVDGDCEVVSGWLNIAKKTLEKQPEVGVVCGRRRERFPNQSIYNLLCDMEWNTPIGETKACGGDAMMRVDALQSVEGFNPLLIAGEEPELCIRLREKDWKIWRLDAEMTLHDANMTRFSQWWRRNQRAGYAYAEGAWLHGKPPEKHWVKESRSIWLWGLGIPLMSLSLIWLTKGFSLALFALYPLLTYRIYGYQVSQTDDTQSAFKYAVFCVLGKFPQLLGQIQFHSLR